MSTGQIVVYATSYSDLLVQERAQSGTFTDIVDATRESRPRRSIALLSFDEARLTHAGIATRDSTRVATGKVRVRFHELREIVPVRISDLAEGLPSRLRHHFELSLSRRWVPPRTWEACRRLITTDLRNQQILEELERLIEGVERAIPAGRLRVLEEERDALGLALGIFGRGPNPIPFPDSLVDQDVPFLGALLESGLPEDAGIAHDARVFNGWVPGDAPAVGAITFENRGQALTVVNVN